MRNAVFRVVALFVIGVWVAIPARSAERSFVKLKTLIIEKGKPIRLEVVVYHPRVRGPYPLLVFNHGSTGYGRNPKKFKRTTYYSTIARHFIAKGWMVVFPQRRGRGRSDGLYDEGFGPHRRAGYVCSPKWSLPGADRALTDINAAVAAILKQYPRIDRKRILVGGNSRGGILAIAYAGKYPDQVRGAINFVGGWMSQGCLAIGDVNATIFRRGGKFSRPTLWLYGDKDRFYSLSHSRSNFAVFKKAGGKGRFYAFKTRNKDGHKLWREPKLWRRPVDKYLNRIGLGRR